MKANDDTPIMDIATPMLRNHLRRLFQIETVGDLRKFATAPVTTTRNMVEVNLRAPDEGYLLKHPRFGRHSVQELKQLLQALQIDCPLAAPSIARLEHTRGPYLRTRLRIAKQDARWRRARGG